jgi:hypothetical protein
VLFLGWLVGWRLWNELLLLRHRGGGSFAMH